MKTHYIIQKRFYALSHLFCILQECLYTTINILSLKYLTSNHATQYYDYYKLTVTINYYVTVVLRHMKYEYVYNILYCHHNHRPRHRHHYHHSFPSVADFAWQYFIFYYNLRNKKKVYVYILFTYSLTTVDNITLTFAVSKTANISEQ